MRRNDGFRQGAVAGLLAVLAILALPVLNTGGTYFAIREAYFDQLIQWHPRDGQDTDVYPIDMDAASFERMGAWPWRRQQIAQLIKQLALLHPQAIAMDVLLDGPDRTGPRAMLSNFAQSEKRPELASTANTFLDEDKAIAAAADAGVPVVFGLGLTSKLASPPFPSLVLATSGTSPINLTPVSAKSFNGPPATIADNAAGLGVLSLDVDADGKLRRVPLLFSSSNRTSPELHASLALEAVRSAEGASTIIYDTEQQLFEAGSLRLPAPDDGLLRINPRKTGYWRERTIPAWRIMRDGAKAFARPPGEKAVFVLGSSAPEAAAYLPTAHAGASSTLFIQSEAIDQIRSGKHIRRASFGAIPTAIAEHAIALFAGTLAIVAALTLPPLWLALLVASMLAAMTTAAVLAFTSGGILFDVIPLTAAILVGAIAASLTVHAHIRANRALVESRFARYLDPKVVDILARNPQHLRIAPQRREVTAIFTDLEGFTSFSETTPPSELIAVLDRYFELIANEAVRHGGMVDKIVGDAIHVFFNMPLDQPDHVEKALGCVRAIARVTATFRAEERQQRLGFGRTRIGMDTGWASVGDIGGGDKLDYTAHGEAINRAARLQGMARDYPSGILIGEGAVSRLQSSSGLQLAGEVTPRGLSKAQKIYTLKRS